MSVNTIDRSASRFVARQRISTSPGFLARLIGVMREWQKRSHDRAALAGMDQLALKDIQASPATVELERKRWFWQAPLGGCDL